MPKPLILLRFLAEPARCLFVLLIILEAADVLMVRERLNDACPLFFWRVCLALILLAMSIGLVQVAGSATTLPLRGPDVHLNFRVMPPDLLRPSTLPPTSVITSTSYNSNSLMSVFNLSTHTFQRTGFNALASTHTFQRRLQRTMYLPCHTIPEE